MKKLSLIVLSFILVFALVACSKDDSSKKEEDKNKENTEQSGGQTSSGTDNKNDQNDKKEDQKVDEKKDQKEDEADDKDDDKDSEAVLGSEIFKADLSALIANGKSIDALDITEEKFEVKKGGIIEPGVYDVEVLSGDGNIMVDRKDFYSVPINLISDAKGSEQAYPSTCRLIFLEGDEVEIIGITKIKLTALTDFSPKTEFSNGNFIVGKDILPGKYKLSTNVTMDPKYDVLGWEIEIYNPAEDDDRTVNLNPGNMDAELELVEGEIMTVDYDTSIEDMNPDEAKLIFTKE